MNDRSTLTDARLRKALTPAADAAAPAALLRDALAVASRTRQRRSVLRLPWGPDVGAGLRLVPSPLRVTLVAAVVILALLGVALVAGQLPEEDRANTLPLPSLPSAAGSVGDVLALSWDEAYVVSGDSRTELWHFFGGKWNGPESVGGSIGSIVALPGGGLAASTTDGVLVHGSGGWSATPLDRTAILSQAIATSPDGSIWAADHKDGPTVLVQLHRVDGKWRASRTACPAGGSLIAATSDGAIWTGGFAYSGTSGLARYDGNTCAPMILPGGSSLPDVVALAAGPSGEVAVAAYDPPYRGSDGDRSVLVVYNGTTPSTLNVATSSAWFAPMFFDGSGDLWVNGTASGLVRWHHANGSWVEAPAAIKLDVSRGASLAGDGTLWYVDLSGTPRRVRL